MADLFKRTGLEQDTGDLKERWAQEGSEVVNIVADRGSDGVMYTVTAGKKLYIVGLSAIESGGTGGSYYLRDGITGDYKFGQKQANVVGTTTNVTFSTPLVFEDTVFYDETGDTGCLLTLTGWEE